MAVKSALYSPAKTYVQAALTLIAEKVPKAPPQILAGLRDWIRSGDLFMARDRAMPYYFLPLTTQTGKFHVISEYDLYVQALKADPNAARTPVSSALGQYEAELVRWGVMEGTFGHKLGLELRICKPPGVGASLNQDFEKGNSGLKFISM